MRSEDDATTPESGATDQGGRYEEGPAKPFVPTGGQPEVEEKPPEQPPVPAEALEPKGDAPPVEGDGTPPPPPDAGSEPEEKEPLVPAFDDDAEELPLDETFAEEMPDVPIKAAEEEPKALFWVGTTKDCPIQNVVCGISFPRFTGSFQYDAHGNPIIPPNPGVECSLTAAKVAEVKDRVAKAVVRWRGNTAVLVSMASARFRPSASDQPLGKYVFMVRVGEMMPRHWRKRIPPTLIRREE